MRVHASERGRRKDEGHDALPSPSSADLSAVARRAEAEALAKAGVAVQAAQAAAFLAADLVGYSGSMAYLASLLVGGGHEP